MKKALYLTILLFISFPAFAQPMCGFDELYRQSLNDPVSKSRIDQLNNAITISQLRKHARSVTNESIQSHFPNAIYTETGLVYQVPVVVHIINKGGIIGSSDNPSDQQIINMIDYVNKIYSATNPNYPAANRGVNIPIRFVLAKRDPDCNLTTGINRVDASQVAGYADYGLKYGNTANGAETGDVKTLSHWPRGYYYNIWLVHKMSSPSGNIIGYANYPGAGDIYEGTVLVTNYATGNYTYLAHELGHAMGLIHTFGEGEGNACKAETDCTTEGDRVCDTEPSIVWTGCSTGTNPCTNAPYAGVQYNIMNYGGCLDRFTHGQGNRAVLGLLEGRTSLLYSLAIIEPGLTPAIKPMSAPPPISFPGNAYNSGPTDVILNDLHYASSGYVGDGNTDFKENFCLIRGTLPRLGATLDVTTWANRQYVKAWIDFNNSGSFESAELVLESRAPSLPSGVYNYVHSAQITPAMLTHAVSNTPLRMRIRADRNEIASADSKLGYGQTEDFAITIEGSLPVIFSNVEAFESNGNLNVQWTTESEENNDYFEIEGSRDGIHFEVLGMVKSATTHQPNLRLMKYEFSISSTNLQAIFAASMMMAFLPFMGRKRQFKKTAWLIGMLWFLMPLSCSKTSPADRLHSAGKLWIKIAQIDKDGGKTYSKIIDVMHK